MNGKKGLFFLLLFHAISSLEAQITHVVLDLGGVLIRTSGFKTFKQIGMATIFNQAYTNGLDPIETKKRLYQLLNLIEPNPSQTLFDDDGLLLPSLMVKWLLGEEQNSQIRAVIEEEFTAHKEWFSNKSEYNFMINMIRMIFTSQSFINTRSLDSETVQFVKECKKNGYKLIVLSNWDKQSFKPMCTKFNSVFCLFDAFICSGYVGSAKPYLPIYHEVFKLAPPNNCVLIDDQEENIQTAAALGMKTIHVKKKKKMIGALPDIALVKKEFNQLIEGNLTSEPIAP